MCQWHPGNEDHAVQVAEPSGPTRGLDWHLVRTITASVVVHGDSRGPTTGAPTDMSIWKDQSTARKDASPPPAEPAAMRDLPLAADFSPTTTAPPRAVPAASNERESKESLIAADLTIEGKIEGAGHIRIAGKFKGDVNVQGDLTIEKGAKLNGSVRARKITVAGELEGNIESAAQVELLSSGVIIGDVKAGSLTGAAGSRMRGQADFGWEEGKSPAAKPATAPAENDATP